MQFNKALRTSAFLFSFGLFASCGNDSGGSTRLQTNPTVSISDAFTPESADVIKFVVSLSQPSSEPVSLNFQTSSGTGIDGQDFTGTDGLIVIAPGQSEVEISVPIIADSDIESDETLMVELSSIDGTTGAIIGDGTAVGTIVDEDSDTTATVSVENVSVSESAGTLSFEILLSEPVNNAVLVQFGTESDTAIEGADFVETSGSAVIQPGFQSTQVNVPVVQDAVSESDESLSLLLFEPTNASLVVQTVVGTITDDDAGVGLSSLSIDNASASETSSTLNFTVRLSAASDEPVTVDYSTEGQSATDRVDYSGQSGLLTFPTGSTRQTISVPLIDDSIPESNETIFANLSNASNATITDGLGVGTITDNDSSSSGPGLRVSDGRYGEGAGAVLVPVELASALSTSASVKFLTVSGSATAGTDFRLNSGTLNFAPGETVKNIYLNIISDTNEEFDETLQILLSEPRNASISDAVAQITIMDNDGGSSPTPPTPPTGSNASISIADRIVREHTGTTALLVTRAGSTVGTSRISYATNSGTATSGSDFRPTTGTLTFGPGDAALTIYVPILNDSSSEGTETFTTRLSNPVNANIADGTSTITIVDDESGTVTPPPPPPPPNSSSSITIADRTVSESIGNTALLVTRAGSVTGTSRVNYLTRSVSATSGSDFRVNSGTLTFPPGSRALSVYVSIFEDSLSEGTETLTVALTSPVNATIADGTGVVTIIDNDGSSPPPPPPPPAPPPPPSSTPDIAIADAIVSEGVGSAVLAVTLANANSSASSVRYITAPGSAAVDTDFTGRSGTLTFSPGVTTRNITIPILNDSTVESTETFSVSLSSPVNATISDASGRVTITDNDTGSNPVFGLSTRPSNTSCIAPARTSSGGSGSFVLRNAFPNLNGTVALVKAMQAPGDNSKWYVLQTNGQIKVFDNTPSATNARVYADFSSNVISGGEKGALGMAFHPSWPAVKEIFVSYTSGTTAPNLESRISRLRISNDASLPASFSEQIIMRVPQPDDNHNGGEISFGNDGLLYIGLGDGGNAGDPSNNSQNTRTLLGSMLRIGVVGVSSGYTIPSNNPFASNQKCTAGTGSANCPEIYAWGFRNPWRWSFDRPTGRLWLGDVGQDTWEEIDTVTRGGNYGWRCREGRHNFQPTGCTSNLIDPVFEYGRSGGNFSISGGFVYRGTANPSLRGRYIYGDFASGRVWALSANAPYTTTLLGSSSGNISGFAIDNAGEVFALDFFNGTMYQVVETSSGGTSDNVPTNLASTGCVSSSNPRAPAPGMIPYEPAASFWSDNAIKDRWVGLPNGSRISVNSNNDWSFPPGTVLMKNFRLGSTLVETRLLMRHPDGGWAGYTYEWNAAQTAATRIDSGKTRSVAGQNWIYPSQTECLNCHTSAAGYALGPETAQINHDFRYPSSGVTDNQLETLNHIGLFSSSLPAASSLPALADPTDTSASLEARARAYLYTNCAQCHQPGGPSGSTLNFSYAAPMSSMRACNVAPSSGNLGISNAMLIAPGNASRSIVLQRMLRSDSTAMPPLGRSIVDQQGTQLIAAWINSLSSCN